MIRNGIDITEIARIRRSAENPRFLEKIYGAHERAELAARGFAPQHLADFRFARWKSCTTISAHRIFCFLGRQNGLPKAKIWNFL